MKAERFGLRPGDGVIYALLLLLCAALFLLPLLRGDDGKLTAQIISDGTVAESIVLSSLQTEETRVVHGCRIVLRADGVRVAAADCPDRLCVRTGTITRAGEAIACVPNHVVVVLRRADGKEPFDGVAY